MNSIAWILFQIMVGNHHFQSFCGHLRVKIWPTWPKSISFLNTHPISVHRKFGLDCMNTFSENGWKLPFRLIFSHFLATRGPKLGQRRPKANQFWTLTQQTSTPNLKWTEWLLFQIMVGNPRRTDARTHGHTDADHSYVSSRLRRWEQKQWNVFTHPCAYFKGVEFWTWTIDLILHKQCVITYACPYTSYPMLVKRPKDISLVFISKMPNSACLLESEIKKHQVSLF